MTHAVVYAAPRNSTQAAVAIGSQVSSVPAVLLGIAGYNSKASAQYIQLHDAASAPADTAVPAFYITVPASSNWSIDFGVYGMNFVTGIYACNSSTAATKTAGSADCSFFGRVAPA